MEVLFLTEGGPEIGFGHITRNLSIYQAFGDIDAKLKMFVHAPWTIVSILNGAEYELCNWKKEKKIKKADVIIIDSYLADKEIYYELKERTKLLVCIDDYQRIEYPEGSLIVNCVIDVEKEIMKNSNNTYLLGSQFAPIRKQIIDAKPIKINYTLKNVLITVGGMDFSPLLLKIIRRLVDEFPWLEYHVIVPQQTFFEKKSKLHIYPRLDIEDYIDLIGKCDICISGGGQTTYELAKLGMPTISICLADNQINNLRGFQNRGFIDYVGPEYFPQIDDKIVELVKRMTSHRVRFKKSQLGQKIIDGYGGKRICQKILNLL